MRAKLCVTVTGQTMADLRRRRDEATDADLVELRVDTVADPSAAAALAGRRVPVIFTCRPRWEGGCFAGSEEERRRLLLEAQQLGAEYVDVEWKAGLTDLVVAREGRGVVLSMHDFAGVPADLADRARAMRATGAEVVKLAAMAERLTDALRLRAIATTSPGPMVVIAMGEAGLASRLLASQFGSAWTYAGDGVAPGQLPADRLVNEFAYRTVSENTALYGVVGRPIMHSLSPLMHNAAFRALSIDAVYLPLAASDFDDFLEFADAVSLAGASVTAPFKLDAFDRADDRDAISQRIRSANTLRRQGGRWEACNTDVAGFLAPFGADPDLRGKRATVLGAGGAARAAVVALMSMGVEVSIAARRHEQAATLADAFGCAVAAWPPRAGSWDMLINATPVGTAPAVHESPLPAGPFTGKLVYDLVYNPLDTQLLRDAKAAGCRTISGIDMLVAQAQRQFEWWTGRSPSADVMRQAAIMALSGAHSGGLGPSTPGTPSAVGTSTSAGPNPGILQ
jgi:3-dehydroquinate dehydratase/shikimate dehydrogenase